MATHVQGHDVCHLAQALGEQPMLIAVAVHEDAGRHQDRPAVRRV
jgi:hypothetical protein